MHVEKCQLKNVVEMFSLQEAGIVPNIPKVFTFRVNLKKCVRKETPSRKCDEPFSYVWSDGSNIFCSLKKKLICMFHLELDAKIV